MSKINNIYRSLKLNYKSWIALLISSIFLSWPNINYGLLEYVINTFILYYGHVVSHWKLFYPFNYGHIYHHENVNFISSTIQILIEVFAVMTIYILIIVIFGKKSLNPYAILMFSIFYTTIHNINYSILHVNKIHEKHHEDIKYNYGPDIVDIIMDTKYDPENDLENTDHYIPNIVISTLIAIVARNYISSLDELNQEKTLVFLGYTYLLIFLILFFLTLGCFYKNYKKLINDKLSNMSTEDMFMFLMEEKWKHIMEFLKTMKQ